MSQLTALIGDIQKFSTEDGPGIRTTVFIKGCPLRCKWCHNPEMIAFEQEIIKLPNSCIGCGYCLDHCPEKAVYAGEDGRIQIDRDKCNLCMECADFCYARALRPVAKLMTSREVMAKVIQDKGFYGHTGGGMTISGGEMLSHADFAEELIDIAAGEGIGVCLDTSGFGDGDRLYELAKKSNVTNILYDIKSIDNEVHKEYMGFPNDIILENLRKLAADPETKAKLIMRMPLIHDVNDTEAIIEETGKLYQELGVSAVNLLPYHSMGISKAKNADKSYTEFVTPSDERVQEIKKYFESLGLKTEIPGQALNK